MKNTNHKKDAWKWYLSHKLSLNPEDSAKINVLIETNAARSIFKLISLLWYSLVGLAIKRCDLSVEGRKMTLYLCFPLLHNLYFFNFNNRKRSTVQFIKMKIRIWIKWIFRKFKGNAWYVVKREYMKISKYIHNLFSNNHLNRN